MKKALFIIPAAALLLSPLALIGHGSTAIGASAAEATPTNIYMPFNEDNFDVLTQTGDVHNETSWWTTGRYGTFWLYRMFNAMDDFYDGNRYEQWTGTVTSKTWHQDQRYITFTLGGSKANKVEIFNDEGKVLKTIVNDYFTDPTISCNMLMRVVDLGEEFAEDDLYLKITDSQTSGFGFVTFGDLRVNQTIEEAAASVGVHRMNLVNRELPGFDGKDANSNIKAKEASEAVYDSEAEYAFVEDNLPLNFEEGFEVDQELSNWAYDLSASSHQVTVNVPTGENDDGNPITTPTIVEEPHYINFAGAVSSDSVFWGEEVPFNKTGEKFFAGGLASTSASTDEAAKYRLVSSPFKMNDLGLFSAKMGGRTAKVELVSYPGGEVIYSFVNDTFGDPGDIAHVGRHDVYNATMVRHIFEVPSAAGKNVCIAISDYEYGGNWGNIFFDEITTIYAAYPSFKLDLISQKGENSVIKDSYHLEEGAEPTALSEAAAFVTDYYAKARSYDNGFSYCGVSSSLNDLVTAHTALSPEARAIVDLSDDYSYGTYEAGEAIYQNQVQLTEIGASMANLSQRVKAASEGGVFKINEDNAVDYALLLALAGIAAASIVALVVLYRRKRQVK